MNTSEEAYENIQSLVEQIDEAVKNGERSAALILSTVVDPEDPDAYNYSYLLAGELVDIADALINRLIDNALEEDGVLYQLVSDSVLIANECIEEAVKQRTKH